MTITIHSERKDPMFWVVLALLMGFLGLQIIRVVREERAYRESQRFEKELRNMGIGRGL